MQPLRASFLALSRVPPVLMLFVVLGLSGVVTMYVMGVVQDSSDKAEQAKRAADAERSRTAKVVYAAKNIDENEMIGQEALTIKDVPAGQAPVDSLSNLNAVVGQQAAYAIAEGTLVSQHALKQARGVISQFEGRIRDGMRAVTFGVDTNSGVAGFVSPGSHVDLIAITGAAENTKAAPVLSDVEVIAVGTTYQKEPGGSQAHPVSCVTVSVSPAQAMLLLRAESAAKICLALRSETDHTPLLTTDVGELFRTHKAFMTSPDALLPPVAMPLLPPPEAPKLMPPVSDSGAPLSTASLPSPEVEMWLGSKRDLLALPRQ